MEESRSSPEEIRQQTDEITALKFIRDFPKIIRYPGEKLTMPEIGERVGEEMDAQEKLIQDSKIELITFLNNQSKETQELLEQLSDEEIFQLVEKANHFIGQCQTIVKFRQKTKAWSLPDLDVYRTHLLSVKSAVPAKERPKKIKTTKKLTREEKEFKDLLSLIGDRDMAVDSYAQMIRAKHSSDEEAKEKAESVARQYDLATGSMKGFLKKE